MEEESGEEQEDWGSSRSEGTLGGLPYEGLPYEDDYKMVMFEEESEEKPILPPPPVRGHKPHDKAHDMMNMFPIKKNLSAYNYFLKDKLGKDNYSNNKHRATGELMKELAVLWKGLSSEERTQYERLASDEKIEYQKFKKTKSFKAQKAFNRAKQKGALPPFVRFQKEERSLRAEEYRKMGLFAATKEISEKWKNMSLQSKQKYIDEYKHERKLADKGSVNAKVLILKRNQAETSQKSLHQPFPVFLKENYGKIKQANPTKSHIEVMREASLLWSKLSSEAKRGYYRSEKPQTLSNEFIN